MPAKTKPTYNSHVLRFAELIDDYEARYPTASGWDRYMLGRKAAEYRGNLAELRAGRHFIVMSGFHNSTCVCGLEVPTPNRGEDFPEFLNTPGHLDEHGQETKVFYYFKYSAPQHYELYLVCQACHILQKQEDSIPRKAPEHNCNELIATLSFEI